MNDFFSLRQAIKATCFVSDLSFIEGGRIYAYSLKPEAYNDFPYVRLVIEDSEGDFYPFSLKVKLSPEAEDEVTEGKLHKVGDGFKVEGLATLQPLEVLSVGDTAKILGHRLDEVFTGGADLMDTAKLEP